MGEPAYEIKEIVAADARTTVYRAVRRSDGGPVVLKALDARAHEPREVERLRNELAVAGALDRSKVLRPLSLDAYHGMPALVREDFAGPPLERLLDHPLETELFLKIAIGITSALECVHRAGLVHKDLTPRSIFVRPGTGEVRLSEFGLAARIPRQPSIAQAPELIEGSLPYMSPEQTGRSNRSVDSRSDLYSLGVLFFQMLTGRLPFWAVDPLGWIHAHVARPPPAAHDVAPQVPPVLSAIITRLMAKTPEARYQSARGLRHDLERVRDALAAGRVEPFPLGEVDVSDRLKIPQHLYGREAELERLRHVLERMSVTGQPALALVSGYSGIGKSSLVHELLRSIEHARGTFFSGKFDVNQRNIPYSTILDAFRRALRDLLGGSEERLEEWRARLSNLAGPNGRLITDIIPEMELIIGPQPPVPPLPPVEAELRFRLMLQSFITAFGRPESPLVLFLDDLQWADLASLKLLEHLLSDADTGHILILGAYRDNEVDSKHPLAKSIARIREAGVYLDEIVLRPLGLDHTLALTADSVRRPVVEVRPLADLIYEKTGGNPFFVIQFFNELLRDGLLSFDASKWRWRWELEGIRQRGYTDNVGELMVTRLARLPASTRALVQLGACIGNTVDPRTLAAVACVDEPEVERLLIPAFEEGLLVLGQQHCRFAHDRVQQAAYSMMPEADRPIIHLRVGRALLETTTDEEIDDHLFEILNHLNRGIALIASPTEREAIARLNLRAGSKARNAAAPAAALQHLGAAIDLLGEDGWTTAFDVACPAHLLRAECEFLVGNIDEAFRALDAIERHAQDVLDRAPGRNLRTWVLTNQGKLIEGTEYIVETARLLGMDLPSPHDKEALERSVGEAFAAFQASMQGRSVESLADLPRIEDRRELALLDTLAKAIPSAFQWNPPLMQLLVLRAVLLAVPDRTVPAFLYAQYGLVHSLITMDYDTALRFGELAIRLASRPEDMPSAGATHFVYAVFLSHRKRHISVSLEHLRIALRLSLEKGDLVHANYCLGFATAYRLYAGEALDTLISDLDEARQVVQRTNDVINGGFLTVIRQAIWAFAGETDSLERFDGLGFSEAEFEATALPPVRGLYGPTKVMLRYMGGDFEGALAAADAFEPLPAIFYNVWHRFYRGLALLRCAATKHGAERARYLERLSEDLAYISRLAEHCPANHGHRDKLLRAELAVLEGHTLQALQLYDAAIDEARRHGFLHEQALAYELAARAAQSHGLDVSAESYLSEACSAYRSWGAEGKAKQLEQLIPSAGRRHQARLGTFTGSSEALDMIAVVKAAQAISSELSWGRVTERLLEVALEQSGASYGCLLFRRQGELLIAAHARAEASGITTRQVDLVDIDSMPIVPQSIVRYVLRSRAPVIVEDTSNEGWYSSDPYFEAEPARSLLCLPILRRVEVMAVLYLENELASGAFTRDRATALELVAAQAAIALANAELFENLERENAERGRAEVFLKESRELLQQVIDNTSAVIFVKDIQGRYLLANSSYDDLFHLAREDVLGKTDRDILVPEAAESLRANDLLALEANRPIEFEERVDLPEGARTFLAIKFPLHDANGRPYAVCGIATDITARKQAEDELRSSLSLLQRAERERDDLLVCEREARAAAEEAVRLRDEFLSVASHELRTPLTSLQLAIAGLSRRLGGEVTPPVQRSLDLAARQMKRMGRLVGLLLDVSRIQAGRLELELREVDLSELVRETTLVLGEDLRRSGSQVTISAPVPVVGNWDAARLEQVIINLLTNAIKFGRGQPIEISVEMVGDVARLTVRDRGIGIPEEAMPRVFERFGRGVSARHYGGLGLGLYIARTIVLAHGGRVFVESSVGEGACFTVELPKSGAVSATCDEPGPAAAF